tara:strand:+ start:312 stop:1184 length:873 start_codon:yes stop_codon:yes gene_type:complete
MSGIKISTIFPREFYDWVKDVYPIWLQLPQNVLDGLVPFNFAKAPLRLDYAANADLLSASCIFQNLRVFLDLIDKNQIQLLEDDRMTSDSLELLINETFWLHRGADDVKILPRPLEEEIICRLDFLKALAVASGLINLSDNRLEIAQSGRLLLTHKVEQRLLRKVFEAAFSKVNPRTLTKLAHPWVHEQAGIIFWGLSLVGGTPRSPEEFARYCFVPTKKFLQKESDHRIARIYMKSVFLDPLTWFGLLESRKTEVTMSNPDGLMFQKSPAFDSFFHFEIERLAPIERAN